MRTVVSVEGLPSPTRTAVLKSLHSRCGMTTSDTERAPHHPFGLLLHRLQALARCEEGQAMLWTGSWLLSVPDDPLLADLYADMATALADALALRDCRHLVFHLPIDVNEAFEHALGVDPDVTLGGLHAASLKLDAGRLRSPLDVQIVRLPVHPYATDNPVALHRLLAQAHAAVKACTSPTSTPPT